jgi:hypothetical protein
VKATHPKRIDFREDYANFQEEIDQLEKSTPLPAELQDSNFGDQYYLNAHPTGEDPTEEELLVVENALDPAMIEELVRENNKTLSKPRRYTKVYLCSKCGTPTIGEALMMKMVRFEPKVTGVIKTRTRTIGYLCSLCLVQDFDYRRPRRTALPADYEGPVGLKSFEEE